MIKSKLVSIYKRIVIAFFSRETKNLKGEWAKECNELVEQLRIFTQLNRGVKYTVSKVDSPNSEKLHKWVGAQYYHGNIVCIPNDENSFLVGRDSWAQIGNTENGLFKWTGGCVWNNAIYAYPRTANSFLKIDIDNAKKIEIIPLTIQYDEEHHYCGVCTKEGIVYQPPRNVNHVLKTDLKTGISQKINIVDDIYKIKFRYCGSIIHPNGYIYFFPEVENRVIKLDPKTDKWKFIGRKISTTCFDAKIAVDGNIYGYSAYCKGLMKIDVFSDQVEMIHEEIFSGAYGTKYGIDGGLYSVPGDGSAIYKFDVLKDEIALVYDLKDKSKAKYAGGVTTPEGKIYAVPAGGNNIAIYEPSCKCKIPSKLYDSFFVDNY